MHALAGVQKSGAHQVGGPCGGLQGGDVSRVAVPQDHGQQTVIVAPQIPAVQQVPVGKRPQVAVLGLGLDQVAQDPLGHRPQAGVTGQAAEQCAGRQVLAHELAGPRDGVLVGRLPIAKPHHLEHGRVGVRRRDQPVVDDALQSLRQRTFQGHPSPGDRQIGRRFHRERAANGGKLQDQGQKPGPTRDDDRLGHERSPYGLGAAVLKPCAARRRRAGRIVLDARRPTSDGGPETPRPRSARSRSRPTWNRSSSTLRHDDGGRSGSVYGRNA